MNDDTDGHNKTITAVAGDASLKRQTCCVGSASVTLRPQCSAPENSPHLCSEPASLRKQEAFFFFKFPWSIFWFSLRMLAKRNQKHPERSPWSLAHGWHPIPIYETSPLPRVVGDMKRPREVVISDCHTARVPTPSGS